MRTLTENTSPFWRSIAYNLRCLRGRRCAFVVVENIDDLIAGIQPRIEYTCGGCGTRYLGDGRTRKRLGT